MAHKGDMSMAHRGGIRKRTPGQRVRPTLLVGLSLGLAYGGGAWLHSWHEAEGAFEPGAPPSLVHWLRDSSLALPLVVAAVWLGLDLADSLLAGSGRRSSRLGRGMATALLVTLCVSLVVGLGNPVHGWLFDAGGEHAHAGQQELPLLVHAARDSLLAFLGNLPIAVYLTALLGTGTRPIVWRAAPNSIRTVQVTPELWRSRP